METAIWIICLLMCLFGALMAWVSKASALWVHEEWIAQIVLSIFLLAACFFGYQLAK